MCGIIGYIGPKKVVPILVEGLKRLEYRGYDSAGVAVVDENQINIRRVHGKIVALERAWTNPLSTEYMEWVILAGQRMGGLAKRTPTLIRIAQVPWLLFTTELSKIILL